MAGARFLTVRKVRHKQERKTRVNPVALDSNQGHQYELMFNLIYIQMDTETITDMYIYMG